MPYAIIINHDRSYQYIGYVLEYSNLKGDYYKAHNCPFHLIRKQDVKPISADWFNTLKERNKHLLVE